MSSISHYPYHLSWIFLAFRLHLDVLKEVSGAVNKITFDSIFGDDATLKNIIRLDDPFFYHLINIKFNKHLDILERSTSYAINEKIDARLKKTLNAYYVKLQEYEDEFNIEDDIRIKSE